MNIKPKFIKYEKIFVRSLPAEKIWNMTYCSRTARKNLYRLWINRKLIPVWESAIASMHLYWDKKNYVNDLNDIPKSANVLDLFIDTRSKYEHRAAAYSSWWNWFVLDPYIKSKSNMKNPTLPIPFAEYINFKKLIWVYPYIIDKSV